MSETQPGPKTESETSTIDRAQWLARFRPEATGQSEDWAWATDGFALVALRGGEPFSEKRGYLKPETYGAMPAHLAKWMAEAEASNPATVDLAALRAFAGMGPCAKCRDVGLVTCRECHGSGSRTVICDDCDHDHECKCTNCEDGKADCRACSERRPGLVDGQLFNLRLLARALRALPESGNVSVAVIPGRDPRLVAWTEAERLVLMSLRDDGQSARDLPSFRLSTEARS